MWYSQQPQNKTEREFTIIPRIHYCYHPWKKKLELRSEGSTGYQQEAEDIEALWVYAQR